MFYGSVLEVWLFSQEVPCERNTGQAPSLSLRIPREQPLRTERAVGLLSVRVPRCVFVYLYTLTDHLAVKLE